MTAQYGCGVARNLSRNGVVYWTWYACANWGPNVVGEAFTREAAWERARNALSQLVRFAEIER